MKKNIITLALFTAVILALFLRGFNLGGLISPYWEEVALGYDAYAIAQTGADHHGNPWPVVAFESFGDWKPSGYFYLAAGTIKMLGLSVTAVRLPSMLAGVSMVIGMYFFSTQLLLLFSPSISATQRNIVGVASVWVAAVSSWLLLFSRAAWEVNVATAFLLWGVVLYLYFMQKRRVLYLVPALVLFAGSVYTYHATRMIAPLILLVLLVASFWPAASTWYRKTKRNFKKFPRAEAVTGLFFILLLVPVISTLRSPEVSQRFAETSIFSNLDIIIESNEAIESANTPGARLFFHRYVLFGREILSNALSHVTLDFLFVHGDANKRHSTGYIGLLYYLDSILLLAGAYALVKRYKKVAALLCTWLVIGLLPASMSFATPHALRILPIAPVVIFILAFGFSEIVVYLQKRLNKNVFIAVLVAFVSVYAVQVTAFWRYYTAVYPKEAALEWQYGYEDMMKVAHMYAKEGRAVAISNAYGRASMYYFFMNRIDPSEVQSQNEIEKMDQSEFKTFKNVTFFDSVFDVQHVDVVFVAPKDSVSFEKMTQTAQAQFERVYEGRSPTGVVLWKGYEKK